MTVLLDNVNTDTVSDSYRTTGGPAVVNIRGDDYGGGSIEIQVASANDSVPRFIALENGIFVDDATFPIKYLAAGLLLRVELTGATSPSNVFVEILA